VWRR